MKEKTEDGTEESFNPIDESVCPWCGLNAINRSLPIHMANCAFNPGNKGCGTCDRTIIIRFGRKGYEDVKTLWHFTCPKGHLDACRTRMIHCPDWKAIVAGEEKR